jgi:NADPH2:quinone reductase
MKAILVRQFGGPEVLQIAEVDTPKLGPGQVLVRIKAAGVNPADTYMRTGTYAVKPALPYTPGFDGAGIVESVGPDVSAWKPGDRVYLTGGVIGTYAEYVLAQAAQLYRLPERVSFSQGAGIYVPYFTAYHALFDLANARPGETLLVHGASGGVGTAAVQLARARGLQVIGTAGTDRGRELVKQQGAQHVLDHRSAGYLDKIKDLTGGRGANVIIEMLANVNLGADLKVLAAHGRVVVVGSRGDVQITPRDLMGRQGAILGMVLFNVTPEGIASIAAALGAGLENGTLQPVVGKELPLAEASRAHKEVMEPGAYGKIVLVP